MSVSYRLAYRSTFDHIDLNRLDLDFEAFEPLDGFLDFVALAHQLQRHDADVFGHAALPDAGDNLEFVSEFVDDRALNHLLRVRQPQSFRFFFHILPAIAGMMEISSPSLTGVALPCAKRMSSSFK